MKKIAFYCGLVSLLSLFPASLLWAEDKSLVAADMSVEVFRKSLDENTTAYLELILNNPKAREEYIRLFYTFNGLEKKASKLTLAEQELMKVELQQRYAQILRETVIKHELEALNLDIEALAEERYKTKKDDYKTRRRIKIAQIFIAKKPGEEAQIREKMADLLKQLEADNLRRHQEKEEAAKKKAEVDAAEEETGDEKPEPGTAEEKEAEVDLFAELAKEHSEDVNAASGGFDSRWLMQPSKELDDPVVKAAFDLLRRGEITGVIDGKRGYHILRLMDYVPNRQQEFEEVKDGIITAIRNELWGEKSMALDKELKAPRDLSINDELAAEIISEVYAERDPALKQAKKPDAVNDVGPVTDSATESAISDEKTADE